MSAETSPPLASAPQTLESRALAEEREARKRAEALLETRSRELRQFKHDLENAYLATVEVFASLLSDRLERTSEDLRCMASNAKQLGRRAGLSKQQMQTVHIATVLCDIGKLALPEALVSKAFSKLRPEEMRIFREHPRLAHDALLAIPPLQAVADVIFFHCEHLDGQGYPNRLKGEDIPIESRVLAIVKDFDGLQRGVIVCESLTESESLRYLESNSPNKYDESLVAEFVKLIEEEDDHSEKLAEQRLTPSSLSVDMVTTRDLTNEKGLLILPAGQKITPKLLTKLNEMEKSHPGQILVYVRPEDQTVEHSGQALIPESPGSPRPPID